MEHIYAVCSECGVRFEKHKKANNVTMCAQCSKDKRRNDIKEAVRISRSKKCLM